MVEIKFRIWDKETKKMSLPFGLCEAPQFNCAHGDRECTSGISAHLWPHMEAETDRLVIRQYTGHEDIDGKEIYAGDIVKTWADPEDYGGYEGHEYNSYVVWEGEPHHGFMLASGHGLQDFDFIRVLGNIYEDEEMLECLISPEE